MLNIKKSSDKNFEKIDFIKEHILTVLGQHVIISKNLQKIDCKIF